jgi:CheY-like chemotaxis protein
MAASLRGWNVEVTFAEHGLEALEAIRRAQADILFLDLNMPIMDGYQVLERIRRDDLPTMVIVVSGDVQPEARARVLEMGALEFIKKPCSPEIIAEVLNRYGILSELEHPVAAIDTDEVLELPDYYQEISNVAMGHTGEVLARLLNTFVDLQVPRVRLVSPDDLNRVFANATDHEYDIVSQGFVGPALAGEALLVLKRSNLETIALLMGMRGEMESLEAELEMSISNALIGAFLAAFAKQLDFSLSRATPQILRDFHQLPEHNSQWQQSLMISIEYQLKAHDFHCELLVVFTEDSLPKLQEMARYF